MIATYPGNYDDFREKRGERPSQQRNSVSTPQRTEKKKIKTASDDRQQLGGKGVERSGLACPNERSREQLELEIAVLEAKLARADEDLCRLDSIGDIDQLEARWREREEEQLQLDALMEMWILNQN